MMKLFLRTTNLLLFGLILWQFFTSVSTFAAPLQANPATAPTPFLHNPYYGDRTALVVNSFDHKYPNYSEDGAFMYHDGTTASVADCRSASNNQRYNKCYDGHTGLDIELIYENVAAAAQGTVTYAGWAVVNHEIDLGLMIEIDHGNNYRTRYAHLSAIIYQTGDKVQVDSRWSGYPYFKTVYPQIGTSGDTGNTTFNHLHFDVRYLSNGIWKVVDPDGWQGAANKDPWEVDKNAQGSLIGGVTSYNLWVPLANRTQPYRPINGPMVFDDSGGYFSIGCKTPMTCNWQTQATGGYNNSFRWTNTTNSSSYNYFAQWQPPVPILTEYELQVYIPNWDKNNRTHAARYEIKHAYGTKVVIVDQHAVSRFDTQGYWVSLGHYFFNQGSSNYVRVTDSTYGVCGMAYPSPCGSYYNEGNGAKKLLVDAMRVYAN